MVALRKQGHTYTRIESMVAAEGNHLSRPTTIKILKEAGLTKPATAAKATPASASTPSAPQSTRVLTRPPTESLPVSPNGVRDFMPPKTTQKKESVPVEFECDQCGAEFIGTDEDELPETCPECGA